MSNVLFFNITNSITCITTSRNTLYKLCWYNLYIMLRFMYCTFANSYAYRNPQISLEHISNYLEGNHRDWHWLPASCTPRGSLLFIKTSTATSGITESGTEVVAEVTTWFAASGRPRSECRVEEQRRVY